MFESQAEQIVALSKLRALKQNQEDIMKTASDFRAFFEDDLPSIKEIIKEELGKQFSEKTLDTIRIQHLNIIRKPLNRKVAGIYDNEPKRYLKFDPIEEKDSNGNIIKTESELSKEQNKLLTEMLDKFRFSYRAKHAIRVAQFFNIALAFPLIRKNGNSEPEYSIDILLPDEYVPLSGADYLRLDKISVLRINAKKEFYWLVFTEQENYLVDSIGIKKQIEGRNEDDFENVYKTIPIAILRKEIGGDFHGQPNWNLYNSQLEADISLTDLRFSETYQHYGVFWGVNTNLANGTAFSPNQFIDFKYTDSNLPRPELNCLVPNIDFQSLRDNVDWRIDKALNLEGIPASSTSKEVKSLSGDAKEIDEGELNEERELNREVLYNFELDLIRHCVAVWNYEMDSSKRIDLKIGKLIIEYSEEKPHESISDKKARREMEIAFNEKTHIDFIMEDLEIEKSEAEKIYNQNKLFNETNSPKSSSQKTIDKLLGNENP